jgi:hypothetical protein
MKPIRHANGIYEIQNFLTDIEIDELTDFIDSTNEEDWFSSVDTVKGHSTYWTGKFISYSIPQSITDKMYALFDSLDFINPIRGIQRLRTGESMPSHVDTVDNNIKYGVVIYLNDNFEGGFTEYPELNLYIKPKKGNLVIHDASILHGASVVIGLNTRYILSAFVRGSKDNPAIISKEITEGCCT